MAGMIFKQMNRMNCRVAQARDRQSEMPEENKFSHKKKEYEELLKRHEELETDLRAWEKKTTREYEMNLLHKYNEIKDAAQILLGAIANIEGVTVKELHERFQLPIND